MTNSKSLRVYLENLDYKLTQEELQSIVETTYQLKPVRVWIIMYGPKSSGTGFIEMGTVGDALDAYFKINGQTIKGRPVHANLKKKNNFQNKTKEKKKPVVKHVWVHDQEFPRIKDKLGAERLVILNESTFRVSIPPANVETFPYDLAYLELEFVVPTSYPDSPPQVTVLNDNLPVLLKQSMAQRITRRIQVAYKGKPAFFGAVTWIQNNLENLMVDQVINQSYRAEQLGFRVLHAGTTTTTTTEEQQQQEQQEQREQREQEQRAQEGKEGEDGGAVGEEHKEEGVDCDGGIISDIGSEDSSTESLSEEDRTTTTSTTTTTASSNNFASGTAHRGTQVKFNGLKMENIGILECYQLNMVNKCERCKQELEVTLVANQLFSSLCSRCNDPFQLTFRSELMHENSHILGYIDKEAILLYDVLPSCFKFTCDGCGEITTDKSLSVQDNKKDLKCTNCFKTLKFIVQGIDLKRIRNTVVPPSGQPSNLEEIRKKKAKSREEANELGIQRGKPLPNTGVCKHYKHSKRWLRFPCCNRIYPCDACHDLAADHPCQWAKKMLCGHCSREQSASDNCRFCGANVTGQSRSAFWEGGTGQRDRAKLSKKDPRKYKGLNKTKPNTGK